jgi:hypothetical protein
MILDIPDIWIPSPENIGALPLALRRYIQKLQTSTDAHRMMNEDFWLTQEEIAALRAEIETLTTDVPI